MTIPEFGIIATENVLANDDFFVVIRDSFPVSPGHMLIVARRAVREFQQLTETESAKLLSWIDWTQKHLTNTLTTRPDAFNFGLNDGGAAGQTKPQFHFHVILATQVTFLTRGVAFGMLFPSKERAADRLSSRNPADVFAPVPPPGSNQRKLGACRG